VRKAWGENKADPQGSSGAGQCPSPVQPCGTTVGKHRWAWARRLQSPCLSQARVGAAQWVLRKSVAK